MQIAISSTEAVRNFSELLNNIQYRGDRYTVIRDGKPVASLIPVEALRSGATLADLRKIVQALPISTKVTTHLQPMLHGYYC